MTHPIRSEMQLILAAALWQTVQMDLIVPLTATTQKKNKWILAMVERFTKRSEYVAKASLPLI